MYLSITRGAAEWLLPKPNLMSTLHDTILSVVNNDSVEDGLFVEGPFRILIDSKKGFVHVWNVDYLSGTGQDSIGFIKIRGNLSIFAHLEFSQESLERSIYLINQRLQGLLIDGAFFHRKHDNNIHTLLAGRGSDARHYSLGYYDLVMAEGGEYRSIIINGPSDTFAAVVGEIRKEINNIHDKMEAAAIAIANSSQENILDSGKFKDLQKEIKLFTDTSLDDAAAIAEAQLNIDNSIEKKEDIYRTIGFTYGDWLSSKSPLSDEQRKILLSDAIDRHPIRIIGPGGSGKTLLMQLLASRKFLELQSEDEVKIIYIVHNEAMRSKILQNFEILLPDVDLGKFKDRFKITTLSEYCRSELQLEIDALLDKDASDARKFQLEQILFILEEFKKTKLELINKSQALTEAYKNTSSLNILASLILIEISIAIKGNGLENDRIKYVQSEKSLSNLHGNLAQEDRNFIFDVFDDYHNIIFHSYGVLDPDDLAITLHGSLKTPLWRLQRKKRGFDYIFVDEAQLFSENERKIFALLSKDPNRNIPIALALDEAQSLYGASGAGYSAIGIKDISNQMLDSVHRSSMDILKLAFFIIQRSTNLFSIDFPDFTKNEFKATQKEEGKIEKPRIERESQESSAFSKFILKRVRELRKSQNRQIAVICHDESYWIHLENDLKNSDLPFQVIRERGEKIKSDQPHVVLCRPAQVGGQEFEAVIIVGLESTNHMNDNLTLASAIEQQMIREAYLSITRAKYRVIFAISKNGKENEILQQAIQAGLISVKQI